MQNVSWYLKSSIVSTWDDSFHYIQFLCFSCITYTLRCDITVVFQYVYTYVYTLKFASRNVKNVLIKQNTFSTFLKFSVIKWNSGNGGGGLKVRNCILYNINNRPRYFIVYYLVLIFVIFKNVFDINRLKGIIPTVSAWCELYVCQKTEGFKSFLKWYWSSFLWFVLWLILLADSFNFKSLIMKNEWHYSLFEWHFAGGVVVILYFVLFFN